MRVTAGTGGCSLLAAAGCLPTAAGFGCSLSAEGYEPPAVIPSGAATAAEARNRTPPGRGASRPGRRRFLASALRATLGMTAGFAPFGLARFSPFRLASFGLALFGPAPLGFATFGGAPFGPCAVGARVVRAVAPVSLLPFPCRLVRCVLPLHSTSSQSMEPDDERARGS